MSNCPTQIQTEIRVADLMNLYNNESVYDRFIFICYAIAHLINEKYNIIPDPEFFGESYDMISAVYGDDSLSTQVNAQAFTFMERMGMPANCSDWPTVGEFYLAHAGQTINLLSGDEFKIPSIGSHDFRAKLLNQILKMDSGAVFTINLLKESAPHYIE